MLLACLIPLLPTFSFDLAMDLKPDYGQLAVDLERQELESGGTCSSQVYGQLLAVYLLANDLANAKLLWKRIPGNLKEETVELRAIWEIARALFNRNLWEVYGLLKTHEWPVYIRNIMACLQERTRERALLLVGQSYSHIAIEDLRKLVGAFSELEVLDLIKGTEWKVDTESGHVLPKRIVVEEETDRDTSQEQLQKLTEYVAFLENY